MVVSPTKTEEILIIFIPPPSLPGDYVGRAKNLRLVQSDNLILCHSEKRNDEESLPSSICNRIYETVYSGDNIVYMGIGNNLHIKRKQIWKKEKIVSTFLGDKNENIFRR